MYHKLGIVEEEADESSFWLELITESDLLTSGKTSALAKEAEELVRIIVASRQTLRRNLRDARPNQNSKIKNQK